MIPYKYYAIYVLQNNLHDDQFLNWFVRYELQIKKVLY
jgi:hypothetical protein